MTAANTSNETAAPARSARWRILLIAAEILVLAAVCEAGFRVLIPWQHYFGTSGRVIRFSEHAPYEDRMLQPREASGTAVRVRADANGFLLPDGADRPGLWT